MSPTSRDLLTSHALHHGLRPSVVLQPAAALQRDMLPLDAAFTPMLGAGLVRGRSVLCSGDAALALAMGVVARATQEGAWLAVVGIDDLGLAAAAEQGIALQRTVLVTPLPIAREWEAAVATAIDGFGVLMVHVPQGVAVRKVMTRAQARRVVTVVVDPTGHSAGACMPDIALHTTTQEWFGIGEGSGHVQARDVRVQVGGRRAAGGASHIIRLHC